VDQLRRAGLDARLATMRDDRDGIPGATAARLGLPRHALGAQRIASIRGFLRLARLAIVSRPTILHAEDRDAAILCAMVAPFTRARLVITRHVLDEVGEGRGDVLKRRLMGVALRRADAVIAVSGAVSERLQTDHHVRQDRLRVIYNSIEPSVFSTQSPSEARRRMAWPDVPTIALVGALRLGKGHHLAITATRELQTSVSPLRMIFVGDGELRRELELLAGDTVDFLGGRSDIPDVLAASDIVILPSAAEALPTALIEAALAARPTVATSVGGVPEVVVDGETGVLIPPGDGAALVEAIKGLLNSPESRDRFGSTARSRAIRLFAPARQTEALMDVYRVVMR
jgi:glycosyltransferase involved in cell wall biosynthesis